MNKDCSLKIQIIDEHFALLGNLRIVLVTFIQVVIFFLIRQNGLSNIHETETETMKFNVYG